MMTFASPEYFYLLLLIVPLVLWHFLSRRKREASLKMASTEAYRYVPKSPRSIDTPMDSASLPMARYPFVGDRWQPRCSGMRILLSLACRVCYTGKKAEKRGEST